MRQMPSSLRRIAATGVFALAFCWPLAAATVSKLNDDVLAPLHGPVVAKRILLNDVPLYGHGTASIELEEFEVWAPGGKVIVNDGKSVQYLDPPPMRFFRGLVNGDAESFAYFSVDGRTGAIFGLVATRDGKFAVSAARRRPVSHPRDHGPDGDANGDFDYFLTASDDGDDLEMAGQTWQCEVEKLPFIPDLLKKVLAETDASGHRVIAQGISGTQSYSIAVEVETDDELYANAGNNVTTLTNYITNLSGAVSTIYNRDIHTNLVQQNLHVYTGGPGTDHWTATDASSGLDELGDYYHANHLSLKRSAVVMLSGKSVAQGIAYEGVVCGADFANGGHTGGAYAWAGGIGNLFGHQGFGPVPDPNATNNGTLYGMPGDGTPTGTQTYWPLEEYAHELGHVLAGHHTHCVAITALEAVGTNHPTQLFVDVCNTTDGAGCASGTASAPPEKGTIMSYCHILAPIPQQSRYTLGQATDLSHHELDDYMLNASLGGGLGTSNIVTAVGSFSMSSISGSSSVAANSTGNVASVTPVNGGSVTYSWTITGGTITSSSTISSITYTAGASGSVVLRATIYNTNGCGVTDTKTVTIVTCTAAAITAQPSPATTVTGQDATLSVGASGTATLSYQWYIGNSGDTSSPVGGATGASVVVSPSSTTSYWVRVSNGCGTADSVTVTVTVTTNPPSAASLFFLVTPCRIIDTRNANGPQGGPALSSGGTRTITVAGVCGIPTGTVAISVNVAVVPPSAGGFLTLFTGPSNAPLPLASTINFQTNRTLANNAIVRVGSDSINVYNGGPTLHFVIDVNGYFK